MDFVRTIVNSDILTSIIEIPENLKHRKVEILILPYENVNIEESEEQKVKMARGLLEKYKDTTLLSEENSAWEKAMVNKYENS